MIYLDHNASAPMHDEVVAVVVAALREVGNPSSVHGSGRAARCLVEGAREEVAALVGAAPAEVVFVSGGTEANNLALLGVDRPRRVVSGIEHESVLKAVPEAIRIRVGGDGRIDLDDLRRSVGEEGARTLLSIQLANNETGVIQPLPEIVAIARDNGALVHCDAVQAAGKVPVDMQKLGVDLLSLSAHKIGGPKGIGALIVRDGIDIAPLLRGGGQERGRRAGTENVAAIAGFGAAARRARGAVRRVAQIAALRDKLERKARQVVPEVVIFGASVPRLPNTSCLALPGVSAETQVMALDLAGIAVSSGSACSSGKVGTSHVLEAMGVDTALAACAIRVSLGEGNGPGDIDRFIEVWRGLARRAA